MEKVSTLVCSGKELKTRFMAGWSHVLGNLGRRMAINRLKRAFGSYRPESTTSVFGPNTNAYFPKMYMTKI